MGVTARLDNFQRRHTWLGFPVAVVYKFIDDQGGYLASLITYYGFLSLFPLLVSVLGYTLEGDPCLAARVVGSALVIGASSVTTVTAIRSDAAALQKRSHGVGGGCAVLNVSCEVATDVYGAIGELGFWAGGRPGVRGGGCCWLE